MSSQVKPVKRIRFSEVSSQDMLPIVTMLRAGDSVGASIEFEALIDSIDGVKVFEVHLLKEKALREAGLTTTRRRKVSA